MKRLFPILLIALLLFACEGDQGPMGPAGPTGPEGPEGPMGGSIIYDYGVISNSNYYQGIVELISSDIDELDIVQIFVSEESSIYPWLIVPVFILDDGAVYFLDDDYYFLGWDYLIKIVKDVG